jgi:hypothetical protein
MAGETTTTTLTQLVYAEWISPYIQSYAAQYMNPSQFLAAWDPTNGSSTVSVPRWVSDQGTPADHGTAVDTELDASEATDLTANDLATAESSFSIVEYGLRRDPTDNAIEDAISAEALFSFIAADGASILMAAYHDDICALFASFSNTSGTTNVALTIANIDDALYSLAERGCTAALVGILDHKQVRDFLNALQATSTSMAVFAGSADRQIGTQFAPDQGRNAEGFVLRYKEVDFYRQGLTDTANAAVDVVGSIFARGDVESNRPMAAIGKASRRDFRVELQRDASKRTTEVNMTMRAGAGITQNTFGQKVLSKA